MILSRLDDIRDDVKVMRESMDKMPERYVARGEWDQRNQNVTSQLLGQGREIGQLRADLNSRRAPWWSTVTVVLSSAALLWTIVAPLVKQA